MSNFADRKAEAARLFEPWINRVRTIAAARQHADENGLEYPPALRQGIFDFRREMREAGFPDDVIDAIPGLKLPDK